MRSAELLVRTSVPSLLEALHPVVLAGVAGEVKAWAELVERADRFAVTRQRVLDEFEEAKRDALASTRAGEVVPVPPAPIVQHIDFSRLRHEASESFAAALLSNAQRSTVELGSVFDSTVGGLRTALVSLLRGKSVGNRQAVDLEDLSKVIDSWSLLSAAVQGGVVGVAPRCWVTEAELVAAALGTVTLQGIVSAFEPPRINPEVVEVTDAGLMSPYEEWHEEIRSKASA